MPNLSVEKSLEYLISGLLAVACAGTSIIALVQVFHAQIPESIGVGLCVAFAIGRLTK